jgi:alginate O-acetyltransferase complex protein AlgI
VLFNSYVFLFLFLPLFALFWWAPFFSRRSRLVGLAIASYVFYGYWDWRFTSLMFLSTVIDYTAGARIHGATLPRNRRFWLVSSLACNLGLLAFFKYSGFFARGLNAFANWVHLGQTLPELDIVLPVGISFYTFQSMSYSIDIYRGRARPTAGFWHFAAYVSMFPQLIAGPIVRYAEIETQLREASLPPNAMRVVLGIQFFVIGLAKKLLIADVAATQINPIFEGQVPQTAATAWLAALGYTAQIYFDFSGYSDMAVGLGHILGFRLPQNFDSPYKSRSISEFWRRWHMTLSFWLRDYLYIPLGGSRHGRLLTLRNLAITMLLGGLWHGAAWTFVFWGFLHGVFLIIDNAWKAIGRPLHRAPATALTFLAVVVGWVFFRSPTFGQAFDLLGAMVGTNGLGTIDASIARDFLLVTGALGIAFVAPNSWEVRVRMTRARAVALGAILVVCVLQLSAASPFLYFQF